MLMIYCVYCGRDGHSSFEKDPNNLLKYYNQRKINKKGPDQQFNKQKKGPGQQSNKA